MSEKENIFGDILTPEALKETENTLYRSWNVNSELSRQTSDAVTGLTALLYSVKKTHIASTLPENAKNIENFKKNFDMIAYCLEGFITEFKPIYEQMVDRYILEKLSGTFDKDTSGNISFGNATYESGISYANPLRARNQGWDDGLSDIERLSILKNLNQD